MGNPPKGDNDSLITELDYRTHLSPLERRIVSKGWEINERGQLFSFKDFAGDCSRGAFRNAISVESRLLLLTVAPVAKKLANETSTPVETTIPIAIWEELAKSVRTELDLPYVENAARIILPNAKDYLLGNVLNLVASLKRQEKKDIEVLAEAVSNASKTEKTLVDNAPKTRPSPSPRGKQESPPQKQSSGRTEQRGVPQQQQQRQQPSGPVQPPEPKPALVLTSACYICGAEDETVIWTKSGDDRDIVKVVNRAKPKSFEKNLVQERDASETKEVRRERVILSEFSVGVNYVEGRGASSTIPQSSNSSETRRR
jgi:hypothetical protein